MNAIIEQLASTGLAAELVDHEWQLVWVSDELRVLTGGASDDELGIGRHLFAARTLPTWRAMASVETERLWIDQIGRFIASATPGGAKALKEIGDVEEWQEALEAVEPADPPPLYAYTFRAAPGGEAANTAEISVLMITMRSPSGELEGTALIYGSPLPATVLALVARGDEEMFGRMAELIEPRRRAAAIMFADVEASGALSRRLPSAAYFDLLSSITTAVDSTVGARGGIVGKHAGDGVTAFFLSEQLGSDSAAARAALEAACALRDAAREAAAKLAAEGVPLEEDELRLNVGLHWGGALYMGQVVTDGRLEVTALGDEVNECARIEQTAKEGAILASKALIERLSGEDAAAISVDPDRVAYRTLAEVGGASEKALRDAGALAVTEPFPV